jgi:hypothetical protein
VKVDHVVRRIAAKRVLLNANLHLQKIKRAGGRCGHGTILYETALYQGIALAMPLGNAYFSPSGAAEITPDVGPWKNVAKKS